MIDVVFVTPENEIVGGMSCQKSVLEHIVPPNGTRVVTGVPVPRDRHLIWRLEGKEAIPAGLRYTPTYADERRLAYPPVGDQLDALWKFYQTGDQTPVNDMLAQVMAVKEAYPKS